MQIDKSKRKIKVPFWVQILSIIMAGVLASCIVLFVVLNKQAILKQQNVVKHTVTFAHQDGTIIETKSVEEGKGVFPPKLEADGVFRGWSAGFNSVEADIEVHPVFYSIKEENLFYFDSAYVKEGTEFPLDLYVAGKVNVSSGTITLSYDPEVLEYKKSEGLESLTITEEKQGELTIAFNCSTPLQEKTLISNLTFFAKEKDAYSTQINLTANDVKVFVGGENHPATCATINNKIYFLQEVGA